MLFVQESHMAPVGWLTWFDSFFDLGCVSYQLVVGAATFWS